MRGIDLMFFDGVLSAPTGYKRQAHIAECCTIPPLSINKHT